MITGHKAVYSLVAFFAIFLPVNLAKGQVDFNLGTFVVDNNIGEIPFSIPAGTFNRYSFTTDWSAISGDAWSNEAIWAITDGPFDSNPTFYADPGPSPNSLFDGSSVTLQWNGWLDLPINGPLSAFFLNLQTFGGSSALWANSVLQLAFQEVVPPTLDLNLGVVATEFAPLIFDTFGSNFDTELGLYDSSGNLLDVNDDISSSLQSMIVFPEGLPQGDYFMVLGGFDTTYGSRFDVTPGFGSGDFVFRVDAQERATGFLASGQLFNIGFTVVPEPNSFGLVFTGLLLLGYRRRTT